MNMLDSGGQDNIQDYTWAMLDAVGYDPIDNEQYQGRRNGSINDALWQDDFQSFLFSLPLIIRIFNKLHTAFSI